MSFIIHIAGPAESGKTLLARWIDRAHSSTARAILEWGGKLTPESLKAIEQARGSDYDVVIFVGDWPAERVGADMVINVQRGSGQVGSRYSSHPPEKASPAHSALPGEKSPSPERPDPSRENASRCNTGTKPKDFSGLMRQFRAARELLSRASADILIFPSLRLLNKTTREPQP